MAEQLLNEASYSLVRTNPKLTANVKLVVDSDDNLYLESFSANNILSDSAFKAFRINYESSYEKDVFQFFNKGRVPKNIAYEAFQQFEDIAVLSKYKDQYEMFYDAGANSISSEAYTEDLGILAPLWLNEQIPNYFVIFRLDDPAAINNKAAPNPLDGVEEAQTSEAFTKNVLENCTAIKTFDLTEESHLGSYLRNYRGALDFPEAPLTVSWRKDEPFLWNGISYDKGGFVSRGEFAYEDMVTKDGTIIQDEYFITQGFQRNGILVANLINLQFLFTDEKAPEYSYNRYFGMYVNAIDEGDFDLSGEGFYKGREKTQTPPITTITEVSEKLNTPLELENPFGIMLYLDPSTITTQTGVPTPPRVNEVESIFYVKDKKDNFHTIKKGSNWGRNEIRLFDEKIDISLLTGFKKPKTFAKAFILEDRGQAMASFKIEEELPVGYRIRFYDGSTLTDEVAANTSLTNGPGTSYEQFFNPTGTVQEIAKALFGAINIGIPEDERFFDPSYDDDTVYVRSRYPGSRFNQLRFEIDTAYPLAEISTFPSTSQFSNFTGGSDVENSRLRVDFGAKDRFTTDRYVRTNGGYANILGYTPYLEKPIYDPLGNDIIGYEDIDKYSIIQLDRDDIYLTSIGQAALYIDYKPSFGRFSFFDIKDFDVDFYSDLYSQEGELNYEYEEYSQTCTPIEIPTGFVGGEVLTFDGISPFMGVWQVPVGQRGSGWSPGFYLIPTLGTTTSGAGTGLKVGVVVFLGTDWVTYVIMGPYNTADNPGENYAPGDQINIIGGNNDSHINVATVTDNVGLLCPTGFLGVGGDPDVLAFYEEGGFADLIGLLRPADPDVETDVSIPSEYDRLEENFLRTQAVASRITPYINKWGYYKYGKDVRNHPYRFDLSEAFAVSNFAPSQHDFGQDPINFTHEWYYLSEIPEYFTKDAVEASWSYFDKAPTDEVEEDTVLNTPYIPGTFQKVSTDGFVEYFLVDRFKFKNEIILIDKQVRWGTFSGGDGSNFAETFLRGVKIIAKPKAQPDIEPNFNARALEYLKDGSFNGYKFSAILIPNAPDKPNVQIKFVKNDKWKTVTMMIFLTIDWDFVDGGRQSIDRTLLYSLESRFNENGAEIIPDSYADSNMQGAISLNTSAGPPGDSTIRGMEDDEGIPTKFLSDITLGANGSYNDVEWNVGVQTFRIRGISQIVSDTELKADGVYDVTAGLPGTLVFLPSWSPAPAQQEQATYTVLGGGFNSFSSRMDKLSFARILDSVSNGDPSILYETINEDGSKVLNADGSVSQTFMVELRAQDTFLKSVYVGVLPDPNKPTIFNLTDIIGYDLSLQGRPRVMPMSRHSGNYEPISRNLLKFRDPYANIDFNTGGGPSGNPTDLSPTGGGNIPDEEYKLKVLDLTRYANTQFYSEDLDFGQIHNFFYHKVNTEDPSTILELSTTGAFQSLYPLINEVGIDYRDFYIFSSNWEPGYYRKSIDKSVVEPIIGTRSMLEKKSFFGSKYLNVPQSVTLETFVPNAFKNPLSTGLLKSVAFKSLTKEIIQPPQTPGDFVHKEDSTKIELYVFVQKRLTEYFFEPVKAVFEKYVNPLFGFGDLTTLDDDVSEYILLNIIPLYKLGTIDLYTESIRAEDPTDYTTAELTNAEKSDAGLTVNDNFSSKLLNTNPFDTRLIYNKRLGFSEKIGLSITLEKK